MMDSLVRSAADEHTDGRSTPSSPELCRGLTLGDLPTLFLFLLGVSLLFSIAESPTDEWELVHGLLPCQDSGLHV